MSARVDVAADPRTWPVTTDNPYWRDVCTLPFKSGGLFGDQPGTWEVDWSTAFMGWVNGGKTGRQPLMRDQLVSRYAWAITDPASLAFVAEHAGAGLVEVGAGTGYWAWQLAQLGVTVAAYDSEPPNLRPNTFHAPRNRASHGPSKHRRPVFHPVTGAGPDVARGCGDLTLFLCWPPYSEPMAADALDAYEGQRLVYVGEGDGGCTGDERFHRMLEAGWHEVATHRPIQYWGIHDWITVYERQAAS